MSSIDTVAAPVKFMTVYNVFRVVGVEDLKTNVDTTVLDTGESY